MASVTTDLSVTFDIEPIVKLRCLALDCKYNLVNSPFSGDQPAACILKHLMIDENGKCTTYEIRKTAT
jgi:hypothetical protein